MILVDWELRELITNNQIRIDPFDDGLINPASIDFRLGGKFGQVKAKGSVVDPMDKDSFETEMIEKDTHNLAPGAFVIAHTLESITIPSTIAMICKGKSSLGRLGLANSDMAGYVDPGWSGFLTLELYNHSGNTIRLTKGMKIGQFVFYECSAIPSRSYGETGRYQNQTPGQGSLGVK